MRAEIAAAVKDGMANDLAAELGRAFADRYPAKVNHEVIDRLVASTR
jgi:hypothetical protein